MRIKVLSLISQNKNVLPVVRYRLDGTKSSGYIHLIDKSFGESIWGMEESVRYARFRLKYADSTR